MRCLLKYLYNFLNLFFGKLSSKQLIAFSCFISLLLLSVQGIAQPTVTSPLTYHVLVPAKPLSTSVNSSNTLRWYTTATGGNFSLVAPTPSTANTGTTFYYVSEVDANGVESVRVPIQVDVIFQVIPGVIGNDQFVCDGQTPQLLTNIKPPTNTIGTVSYQWESSIDNSTWTVIPGATGLSYQPGPIKQNTWFRRAEFDQNALQLTNTGFESFQIAPPSSDLTGAAGTYNILHSSLNVMDGWNSTDPAGIEVWTNCFNGNDPNGLVFCAPEGNQIIEMNAQIDGRLYQRVYLTQGQILNWSFYHRGRAGVDSAAVEIYSDGGATKLETLQRVSTGNTAWSQYTGSADITVPTGYYEFSFESIYSFGGPGSGNSLDAIVASSGTGSNTILTVSPGLTYAGYPSSGIGLAAKLINTGEDINKGFTDSIVTGNAYASFLVKIDTARAGGDYFFHLGATSMGTAYKARVFVKLATNGKLAFGIAKGTTSATILPKYTDSVYVTGTTYLLVAKYVIVPGDGNDSVSLFVNPSELAELHAGSVNRRPSSQQPSPALTLQRPHLLACARASAS